MNPSVMTKIYAPLQAQFSRIPCYEVLVALHTDSSLLSGLSPNPPPPFSGKSPLLQRRDKHPTSGPLSSSSLTQTQTCPSLYLSGADTASHLHLPGVLIKTPPHGPIPPDKVLGRATFTRVLRNRESCDIVRGLVAGGVGGGVLVVGG